MREIDLPPAEKKEVALGYLKLTDAAPIILANELGYFRDVGLEVRLEQDVTWANIRDKLATGALDGAQMLAPMPAMATLGISGLRVPLITGLVLSRNGNAITLSSQALRDVSVAEHALSNRLISGSIVSALLSRRESLTFAVVHGFSTHTLLLRRWLREGGVDPDHDVNVIIIPPAQVVDSLQAGLIDGFCAGAPWATIASEKQAGVTVAAGIDVWKHAPEKVFCVSEAWHDRHSATHLRLRIALMRACEWLAKMDNRVECAEILSLPCYLDLPVEQLLPSLVGEMVLGVETSRQSIPDFQVFNPIAPDKSEFAGLIAECTDMVGNKATPIQVAALADQTARPDLFEVANRYLHPKVQASV
tara:strand:- start:616 stop:1698 length:1083 start_codon:yes stop_codon:yes gene_type:complete